MIQNDTTSMTNNF